MEGPDEPADPPHATARGRTREAAAHLGDASSVTQERQNQLVAVHGTSMMFLFAVPAMQACFWP
jgi:heme/copper-type cytochrome/quinol oxidase subunit 1